MVTDDSRFQSIGPTDEIGLFGIESIVEWAGVTPLCRFVEVGVYKGGSAWHLAKIAREQGRELHLFDTFSGIPYKDEIDSLDIGRFADTSLEAVRKAIPDAHFYAGVFPDTMPAELTGIAFAHIDCDQYHSVQSWTMTV